jgi:hypothetical protein
MDNLQLEALRRMFYAYRMIPWAPEHELFIKGELAKLEVLEPSSAKAFKDFYEKRMQDHLALQEPVTQEVVMPPEIMEVKKEEKKVEEKVEKKRGRKKKIR